MWHVNFNEAIAYVISRNTVLPDKYYKNMTGLQRHQSVSIAGLTQLEQVDFIIKQMQKALATGMTFADFVKAVERGQIGVDLPKHRLDNIFRTNIQSAYNRGRWYQQQRLKKHRPYLMYDAINDNRTRPNHRALDGVIRHMDDSFWDTHYPPLGYRCRCHVRSLTEEQALAKGITPDDKLPDAKADSTDFGGVPSQYTQQFDKLVQEKFQRLMLNEYRQMADVLAVKNRLDATVKMGLNDATVLSQWVGSQSAVNAYAKAFASYDNPFDLTVDEYSAIRHYTASGSADLNDLLNGLSDFDTPYAKNLINASNLLAKALAKLPNYEGIVVRRVETKGMNLAEYQPNNVVIYNGYSSSTYGADDVAPSRKVRFVIKSKTGKRIDRISTDPDEQEVLLPRGVKFTVEGRTDTKDLIEIALREL